MTAVTPKNFAVGARRVVFFALNSNGSPAATNTSPYNGVQMVGVQDVNLTIPAPQKITHLGDDRPLAIDYLPAKEAMSGEMTLSQEDQSIYALMTGTNAVVTGEASLVGLKTSQQGNEPQVGMITIQQALDASGARNWRWFLMPKVILYPAPGSMNDKGAVHKWTISPAIVTNHLWETAFDSATEGFLSAQGLIGQSAYIPNLVAWLAATATTQFAMPANEPAINTAKMVVTINGAAPGTAVGTVTKATTQITFQTAPGNLARVVCFYEHA